MKQAKWKLLILFFLCMVLMGNTNATLDSIHQVVETFLETGAIPNQYLLQHGGRTTTQLSKSEIDQLAKNLTNQLRMKPAQKEIQSDGIRYISEMKLSSKQILMFQMIDDQPIHSFSKPYVSIQLRGYGDPRGQLGQVKSMIQSACDLNGISTHYYFSIQGAFAISKSKDLEFPIRQVISHLHAKQVESMKTKRTVSLSLFAPSFGSGLFTRGGEMNLQVATRWNHDNNRILMTMGTPIITIEY